MKDASTIMFASATFIFLSGSAQVSEQNLSAFATVECSILDTLLLSDLNFTPYDSVFLFQFCYNVDVQLYGLHDICLRKETTLDRTLIASNLGLGTHYVILSNQPPDTIQIPTDLLSFHGEIIQVVVTSKSNYLGYLEELLNVPFVLPPRNCQLIGHQSDNRLAVDCAELAVYGMRRMGYSVPYAGPHRITDWLVQTDTLKAGTIIHFGHQVSVLYEDNGVIGKLDPDDLLIHAYKQKAEVISFGYTDLQSSSYLFYAWDWGKLNKNLNNK